MVLPRSRVLPTLPFVTDNRSPARGILALLAIVLAMLAVTPAQAGWLASYSSTLSPGQPQVEIAISDDGDARIVWAGTGAFEILVTGGSTYVVNTRADYVTLAATQELANDRRMCCRVEQPGGAAGDVPFRLPPREFTRLGERMIHGFRGIAYQRTGWRIAARDEADIVVSQDPALDALANVFRPAGGATGFVFQMVFPHAPYFGNAPELHAGALLMVGPYQLTSYEPHDWPDDHFNLPSRPLGVAQVMEKTGSRPAPPAPATRP